jgi:lipoprotein-anchoring transpeptidase ErfK/SrfK
MGFVDGAGIHGTDELSSLGTAASHGCIRIAIPDVIELYNQTSLGTPVYIA